jgi:aminopeptidase YwaD
MRRLLFLSIGLLSVQILFAQYSPSISAEKILSEITYLASDSLKGRKPGTSGDSLAASFIRIELKKNGAIPIFDHGFQRFSIVSDVHPGKKNILQINGANAKMNTDFIPASFSSVDSLENTVVFAGYGFNIHQDSLQWNDYDSLNVINKWVMIFQGKPGDNENNPLVKFSKDRNKALTAKDKGAKGLLIIAKNDQKDLIVYGNFDKTTSNAGIPVFYISWKLAENMLKKEGKSIATIFETIGKEKKPGSFELKTKVKGVSDVVTVSSTTYNIVAKIEGSDLALKNEYIIIGGHYDHLGMGGPESGSRMPDTLAIHNGADDNASGVAGVIELADAFASSPVKPKRSLIFVAFSGEEMGMLGSKEFVKNPPVDLKSMTAMFNFDMIGRMKKDNPKLSIGGTGTSIQTDSLIGLINKDLPFSVSKSPEGYGPSDHASFYKNNIPVFFFTTGVHDDYHTPFDDVEKLDIQQEVNLLNFAYKLIELVANQDKALTFKEAGSKEENSSRSFKVSLGIIPDVVGSSENGMGVDGVKKGGPAEAGGILKGDIITSINDLPVANVYDYMARLNTLKKGQKVKVEVIRNGKKEVLSVQL